MNEAIFILNLEKLVMNYVINKIFSI